MRIKFFLLVFLIIFKLKAQIPNPVNFNTASNATSSGTLPVGSNDLNWTACSTGSIGPYVPANVCGNQAPCCWANAGSVNVNWIVYPHTCSASPAEHSCLGSVDEFYKLSFNLPANTPCGQAISQPNAYCLALDFYSDNCVWEIFVNGISSYLSTQTNPYYYTGFSAGNKTSVKLCSNWQAGTNNIIVHVKSGSNPFPTWTGFMAEVDLTQSSSPSTYTSNVSLNINPSYSVCSGSSVAMSVSGATSYTWNPGGSTGPSLTVSPVANMIYTITGSNGACVSTITTAVNIIASPSLNVLNSGPICNGGTATLSASGATNYSWSPGSFSGGTINVNPSVTTTYTVMGDNGGCAGSKTTVVVVDPTPTLAVSGNTAICLGNSTTLTVNGAANYTWNPGNLTGTTAILNPTTTTLYTIAGSLSSCINTTTILVTVSTLTLGINASPLSVCMNGSSLLSAAGALSYTWSPGNLTGSSVNVTPLMTSTYSVLAVNAGCSATGVITVSVLPTPTVSASSSGTLCAGGIINLFANGSAGYFYNWSGPNNFSSGLQNPYFQSLSTLYNGNYSVTLTDSTGNGCGASASVNVMVYPKPVADFNYDPIRPDIDEQVVFTNASYDSIISWNWYFMNTAQYTSVSQNPVFVYSEPGTYQAVLIVKNKYGCYDTLIKVIEVMENYNLYIPNTFTPNNDNLNDFFQPKGTGVAKYEMRIFDRWGEQLFVTDEFAKGWDGKFQGRGDKICPSDSYTYLIKVTDILHKSHEYAGHVILLK
jgi:gliding motility-associated-like protein